VRTAGSVRSCLIAALAGPAAAVLLAAVLFLLEAGRPDGRLVALLAAANVVGILLCWLVAQRLLAHLGRMTHALRELAHGRVAAGIEETGRREIAESAAALNAAARAIADHSEQLTIALDQAADQRDRFHSIINAASDGLLFYDSSQNIVAANRRCADLLGLSTHELFHEPTSFLRLDVQARSEAPETYDERLRLHFEHESVPYEDHLVLVRPRRRVLRRYSCPALKQGRIEGRVFTYTDVTTETDLEQIKSEFVSMASHELRTPLTSIHGALQLALAGNSDQMAPEDRELLQISLSSTERLVRLVNDLLDLSKIEAGRMPSDRQPLDLRPLTDEAVRAMQGMTTQRHVCMVTSYQETLPLVSANPDQISRVLMNMLSNAVKYSPDGAEITISIGFGDDGVVVAVEDRGPGIAPDQMDKLFKPFCRVGAQERQMTGGTGLGLAITRAIIEQHNGVIRVEPAQPRGSRFLFALPPLTNNEQRAVA
jgi:PAS domain S-box-containing protein